ncbi:MAG: hypothetical protein ACNA7G_07835 [Methylobacter sp.]
MLVSAVKEREQWIGQCSTTNQKLTVVNQELLDAFRNKSLWTRVLEAEPFTGIAAVETETALENYQFKLEDLTVTPFNSMFKFLILDFIGLQKTRPCRHKCCHVSLDTINGNTLIYLDSLQSS